jgi:hypothetical protein
MRALQDGPVFQFADWPSSQVPRRTAGVYTVWRQAEFLYVGMSGRGALPDDFVADQDRPQKALGLWTRLNSHASGRRAGDQFNIYVCDRFIVPALTPRQQQEIGQGQLLLDRLTRALIRGQLSYRFVLCPDGTQALATERAVRAGHLPAGRPYLNPLLRRTREPLTPIFPSPNPGWLRRFETGLHAQVVERAVKRW